MRAIFRELAQTAILALLIFLALQFSVQNFRVEGSSMEPTLDQRQYLLVNKLVYMRFDLRSLDALLPFVDVKRKGKVFPFHLPRRGEVIIFHFPRDPSRDFVKRVIGVPGDVVEIRRGQVFVNQEGLDEPYVTHQDQSNMALLHIPADFFFVLGDNRKASHDSRDWGLVPADNVIGRAWLGYWPLNRFKVLRTPGAP